MDGEANFTSAQLANLMTLQQENPTIALEEALHQAFVGGRTYEEYRSHVAELLAQGLSTGAAQSPYLLEVSQLNQQRMDRLDRKNRLTEPFLDLAGKLQRRYRLLAISEGWCGDAAQTLPVINWIAGSSSQIELRVILRDEHPDVIDQFLTNGGRSIPKVIILDADTNEVLADWGPRPMVLQAMAMRHKRTGKPNKQEQLKAIHTWYARDKTLSTQAEFMQLFAWLESEQG